MSDGVTAVAKSTLADLAPVGLLVIDSRRRIVEANLAAEALLFSSRRILSGRPLSEVIFHDSPMFELIDRAERLGGLVTAPGTPISGPSLQGQSLCDVRVKPVEVDGFAISLNETLSHETAQSVAGVAGFGRILGHEVKNPLAGISGAAQLLERQGHSDQTEWLGIILSEAKRTERLVNRLSAFELFSAPRKADFNVHELLDRVLAAETAALGEAVSFDRVYDPSLPEIMGDADHLHEAFQNIIRNAAEAAGSGEGNACVTVQTKYAAGLGMKRAGMGRKLRRAIKIEIEDNGPGIPQSQQAAIFNVFRSTKSGSRGLGLSIANEVITAHGGTVRVRSQPGLTSFSILLPITRETKNG